MEKYVYYGMLFDIYQGLLKDSNKEIFKWYYDENLTLQEIADNLGVSKSYIGRIIKNTEKKLDELESTLHIYENKNKIKKLLEMNDIDKIKEELKKIFEN
ncbi:MAG TPA: DNA-binding protein [Candidatus Onthocola stercoravium]|nr:DNA-binding protein [Candidatus Onthocola stercoravium]